MVLELNKEVAMGGFSPLECLLFATVIAVILGACVYAVKKSK